MVPQMHCSSYREQLWYALKCNKHCVYLFNQLITALSHDESSNAISRAVPIRLAKLCWQTSETNIGIIDDVIRASLPQGDQCLGVGVDRSIMQLLKLTPLSSMRRARWSHTQVSCHNAASLAAGTACQGWSPLNMDIKSINQSQAGI